jgi:hypothetical protein
MSDTHGASFMCYRTIKEMNAKYLKEVPLQDINILHKKSQAYWFCMQGKQPYQINFLFLSKRNLNFCMAQNKFYCTSSYKKNMFNKKEWIILASSSAKDYASGDKEWYSLSSQYYLLE